MNENEWRNSKHSQRCWAVRHAWRLKKQDETTWNNLRVVHGCTSSDHQIGIGPNLSKLGFLYYIKFTKLCGVFHHRQPNSFTGTPGPFTQCAVLAPTFGWERRVSHLGCVDFLWCDVSAKLYGDDMDMTWIWPWDIDPTWDRTIATRWSLTPDGSILEDPLGSLLSSSTELQRPTWRRPLRNRRPWIRSEFSLWVIAKHEARWTATLCAPCSEKRVDAWNWSAESAGAPKTRHKDPHNITSRPAGSLFEPDPVSASGCHVDFLLWKK